MSMQQKKKIPERVFVPTNMICILKLNFYQKKKNNSDEKCFCLNMNVTLPPKFLYFRNRNGTQ